MKQGSEQTSVRRTATYQDETTGYSYNMEANITENKLESLQVQVMKEGGYIGMVSYSEGSQSMSLPMDENKVQHLNAFDEILADLTKPKTEETKTKTK